MNSTLSSHPRPRTIWAAQRVIQALGCVILLWTAWRAVLLLLELLGHPTSPSVWLQVGMSVPVWLLAGAGSLALLRFKTSGYLPLYAATFLAFAASFLPYLPCSPSPYRFGEALRWQAVNLAAAALLLGTQVVLWTARVPRHREPRRFRWWLLLAFSLSIILVIACLYWQRQVEQLAAELAMHGLTAYEAGRDEEAIEQWQTVIAQYPHTGAWGVAVFNSGVLRSEQGRDPEAIALFERILSSRLDDRDSSGFLMSPYQNYHHRACLEIASCYESLGDYASALRYVRLARDIYPLRSWCATCNRESAAELQRWTQRLENGQDGSAQEYSRRSRPCARR